MTSLGSWLRQLCNASRSFSLGALLVVVASVTGLSGSLLMLGCAAETRHQVLSTLFDGVPPPGTPPKERRKRFVRIKPEVLIQEPEDLTELGEEEKDPDYATYAEVLTHLPKDFMGNVNWVAAVESELIRPRPSIDPEAVASPPMPLNVHLDPGIPGFEVVFPHEAHTYWLRCDNCHTEIFQMKAGTAPMTMTKILEGEYCGRCHGKVAFAPATACDRCHVNLRGGAG